MFSAACPLRRVARAHPRAGGGWGEHRDRERVGSGEEWHEARALLVKVLDWLDDGLPGVCVCGAESPARPRGAVPADRSYNNLEY